jgi:hypothetical protein
MAEAEVSEMMMPPTTDPQLQWAYQDPWRFEFFQAHATTATNAVQKHIAANDHESLEAQDAYWKLKALLERTPAGLEAEFQRAIVPMIPAGSVWDGHDGSQFAWIEGRAFKTKSATPLAKVQVKPPTDGGLLGFFQRHRWIAILLSVAMLLFAGWILGSGANCTNGPVDPATGLYYRTCHGPDFGTDPNQRPQP